MQPHGQHRALIPPFHAATIRAAATHCKSVPQRNSCLRARNRQTTAMKARLTAFALAILGLASLRAQFDALPNIPDAAQRIWAMAAFFTILTNALLTAHLLAITNRWQISAVRAASLLLSIVMVGLIYHGLLSDLWAPTGLGWWADQGLHSAMPLGYAAWWLAFAPKDLRLQDLPKALLWPLLYLVYALIRGVKTGFWPYPFLNADTLGWPHLALNCAALVLAFSLVFVLIWAVARWRYSARPS